MENSLYIRERKEKKGKEEEGFFSWDRAKNVILGTRTRIQTNINVISTHEKEFSESFIC